MAAAGVSLKRAPVVLALAGALVATPVSAEAGSRTHQDPRGDMVTGASEPAPDQVNGDILSVRMRHTRTRVRVRIKLAELVRGATILNTTNVGVVTNEGVRRYVNSVAWAGHWAGEVHMQQDGTPVRCSIHHTNNYVKNVVVIGFSRRCVSRPRWVRISSTGANAFSSGGGMGIDPIHLDDGLRPGNGAGIGVFSPRIRRG